MTGAAQPAGPCVLVIFGAAGDLTRRLLLPALYNLRRAGLLPEARLRSSFTIPTGSACR